METLNNIVTKRFSQTLVHLLRLVDPERKYKIDAVLADYWDRLTLNEQRKLYLYLLYRKWRGEGFYGTPLDMIQYCKPYPTNWNGKAMINRLMKETKMVRAFYNGEYGIYTRDEAQLYEMSEIKPLN